MHGLTRWTATPTFFRPGLRRFVDDFWGDWPLRSADAESFVAWRPAVDVRENEEALTIQVELPGLSKEDIGISLEDNVLTLTGERKLENHENKDNYHRVERQYGRFSRSFRLPATVQTDKADASFKDGLLTLVLPKTEESKPRQIQIH